MTISQVIDKLNKEKQEGGRLSSKCNTEKDLKRGAPA